MHYIASPAERGPHSPEHGYPPPDDDDVLAASVGSLVPDSGSWPGAAAARPGEACARGSELPGQLTTILGFVRELATNRARDSELHEFLDAACEAGGRQDAFLATLVHELRSHLAPIRQALALAALPRATETDQRWSRTVIERQSRQMGLLLDDVLEGTRNASGLVPLRTAHTDLATVVEAAVETASPVLDAKRHRLSVEMPPEPVHCEVDPLRLAQVLSNLLTNAAKYTDPHGEIRLQVSSTGSTLTLCVSDTGIGIPADALEAIFGLYTQLHSPVDRAEGGVGIGLALARHLVTLHGGTIEARSAGLGQGSQFVVQIPRQRAHAPVGFAPSAAPSARTSRSRRVLIADDSPDAAEALAMLLRLDGHEVTVALDGGRALASLTALRPEFALLDLSMPILNGYEVARAIRGTPESPVLVALTGWADAADRARTRAAGFDHHFVKPVELAPLRDLLARGGR